MLLGGAAASWPLAARAQGERMRRIGVLLATGQKDPDTPNRIAAMRQALQSFGWNEGRNLWIDIRFGEGDTKLIHQHAVELVGSNPDAILVLGTVVVMALQQLRALTLYPWLNTAEDEKRREAARWALTHWAEYQAECWRRREGR